LALFGRLYRDADQQNVKNKKIKTAQNQSMKTGVRSP